MSLIVAPDPNWPVQAQAEADRWRALELPGLVTIHHIGSTSVPGLPAKPIIDLLPVFETTDACDAVQTRIESIGYEWLGEFGLPGRRYVRLIDPDTGKRLFHAHCYAQGSAEITRHLALRDVLRDNAPLRAAYTSVKARCAALHPGDHQAYGACKADWIDKAETKALEHYS
ncbi:GrpB family protein [Falsiruegeria mediterranea]